MYLFCRGTERRRETLCLRLVLGQKQKIRTGRGMKMKVAKPLNRDQVLTLLRKRVKQAIQRGQEVEDLNVILRIRYTPRYSKRMNNPVVFGLFAGFHHSDGALMYLDGNPERGWLHTLEIKDITQLTVEPVAPYAFILNTLRRTMMG